MILSAADDHLDFVNDHNFFRAYPAHYPPVGVSKSAIGWMAGGPSLFRVNFGVAPSMADNGNSSLFAMDGDQLNLEDKVLSVKLPTDGASCSWSKYTGKPVFLSFELRFCPITCEQETVSYPAVCGRKTPPTVKLAHTLG